MFRTVGAIIAGNFIWTALWLALNALLRRQGLLPEDPTQPARHAPGLLALLVGSVVLSAAVGWITTAIAGGKSYAAAMILALIHLGLGIFFQAQAWQLMPLWYHVPFLVLILPATLLGAWFRLR